MGHPSADNDGSRALHFAVLAAVALITLSPALSRKPKDDFPLSNYPMFSTNKDPKTVVSQAVALSGEEATVLGPRYLGTDEVLQARATIARAVRGGGAAGLCAEIADRVGKASDLAASTEVEIRTVTHDSLAYFEGDTKPASVRSHARCAVRRSP